MEIISRKEAKSQGLKRYFTGKPCKRGHICERYLSNRCIECVLLCSKSDKARECQRKYREEHRAEMKEYQREYNKTHYHHLKKQRNEYRKAHRAEKIERDREYKRANRVKLREDSHKYCKLHREEKKEYDHKYRKLNPGKGRALGAKRAAAKLQRTPSWANLKVITKVYESAQAITKITGIMYSVDHIIPMRGKLVSGFHVENNLQVIPLSENIKKNNHFDPLEYAQSM